MTKCAPIFFALLFATSSAYAVDVEFEGSYQLRGRYYNSLSLTRTQEGGIPEAYALYGEHRLWLRPKFLLSDKVRLTVDFKGLNNVKWGNRPSTPDSFTNRAVILDQDVTAPIPDNDARAALTDFTVWRAWGDIDTPLGRFSFGRMPLHWGSGIWQNDGMSFNNEYGDTVDRLQFETLIQDTVFIRAAFDTHSEGFINATDDTFSPSLSAAYRSERLVIGAQFHYRHSDYLDSTGTLDLFTADIAADVEFGMFQANLEFLGRFGGGDFPNGINDANVTAFGGVLHAQLNLNPWTLVVEGGYASGDRNDTDAKLKTFSFDPDYNVGVILFEQPMPVFQTPAPNDVNGNRNTSDVLLENSVTNALYLRPSIRRSIVEGLDAEITGLFAAAASLPDRFSNRKSYGSEFQAALNYHALKHFEIEARGAAFLPGSYFRNFQSDVVQGYKEPVFGVQLTSRIRF